MRVKKKFNYIIIIIFLTFNFIVSCSGPRLTSFDTLKSIQTNTDIFLNTLSIEYQLFARYEMNKMNDQKDAQYFALKAIKASQGELIKPEDPNNWDIHKTKLKKFNSAYNQLMKLLSYEFLDKDKIILAKAQVSYDCWLEQQEENWQIEHIRKCKNDFYNNLNYLKKNLESQITTKKQEESINHKTIKSLETSKDIEEKNENTLVKKSNNKGSNGIVNKIKVYFNFDSSSLNTLEIKKVITVIDNFNNSNMNSFLLEGHTDRAGSEKYNLTLSKKRAQQVKDILIKRGINPQIIKLKAYGENMPSIRTKDNVKEEKNRRVEITIN